MTSNGAAQDVNRRTLQPLMPQPVSNRPGSVPRSRNNNTQAGTPTTLKARVNLSESLIDSPASPFASASPNSSSHSTPSGPSRATSNVSPANNLTPTDNPKRIKSPITRDSAVFPASSTASKYASPTLQASGPSGRPIARSVAAPVARSALSPEAASSPTNTQNVAPKRVIKTSASGARLMPSANISPLASSHSARASADPPSSASSNRSFVRSPSPSRQQPPSPKRPTAAATRSNTTGVAKVPSSSYLASPPLAQVRNNSSPTLRSSTSNPSLPKPARASSFQATTDTAAARKQSTASSSSGYSAGALSSPGARTPKSPFTDLPPDFASQVAIQNGPSSANNHESAQKSFAGLGMSLSGVLDEEDWKEIERAKEREKEARENRKVLDLEITNASLLAINAMLERAKQKQSTEISALRRKLREGPQFLHSPVPASPGLSSGSSMGMHGELGDDEDAEEEDWSTILSRDPEFSHIAKCLENLVEEGQNAIKSSAQNVQQKVGLKVVSRFDDVQTDDTFDESDSSFVDDSMLSLDPSPLRDRKSASMHRAPRRPSRLRVSSLTSDGVHELHNPKDTDTRDRGVQVPSGDGDASSDGLLGVSSADESGLYNTSQNSEASEPEAWSRGIASPTSSAPNTRVHSTPLPSIPASPAAPPSSRPASPPPPSTSTFRPTKPPLSAAISNTSTSTQASAQRPRPATSGTAGAMSTMAGFLGWNSPRAA